MRRLARGGVKVRHPAQFVVIGFAAAIAIGTVLLSLPVAAAGPGGAPILTALFTSTSAVCVTGHIVVDTPVYWTATGETIILALIQVGGFGIMTMASLAALVISRRLGLRSRMLAQAETGAVEMGDVRRVLLGVASFTILFEAVAAAILTARFWTAGDEPFGRALWLGVFHAVSSFNNAGFSLFSDSLVRFATDPIVVLTVGITVILGGIGFPVLLELFRRHHPLRRWTMHSKLVVSVTLALLAVGTAGYALFEWSNPGTLGPLDTPAKLMNAFFHAVTPRTAGFNTVDVGAMRETSLFMTDAFMLVGGAPASTAGGIKVTTFALLAFVIWAEMRGEPDVNLFGRRAPTGVQRQALSIALLGVGAVVVGTLIVMAGNPFSLSQSLFEVISAFGTVGLSMGITPDLSESSQVVLIALMFLGRLGPLTLATALVLRGRSRLYRLPEERPIIG